MQTEEHRIKEKVKERYTTALGATRGSCCGADDGEGKVLPEQRVVSCAGYSVGELNSVPGDAIQNSFGCGNPVAFADLMPGETVVDIGSGAGLDCLLAAERVGASGRIIGIDMTPAMLQRAKANAKRAGASNVEFRQGDAENMPVDSESVDCVLSNCVINLSPNKPAVFREALRVLKPGGRLSISDIMVESLPPFLRRSTRLYASCIAGAIPEAAYLRGLKDAGFTELFVAERLYYDTPQILSFIDDTWFASMIPRALLKRLVDRFVTGKVWSARIHARKL